MGALKQVVTFAGCHIPKPTPALLETWNSESVLCSVDELTSDVGCWKSPIKNRPKVGGGSYFGHITKELKRPMEYPFLGILDYLNMMKMSDE